MPPEGSPPVLVFGIDAGDPDLLERWAREGHLPTLAGLMARGCWARTSGPELLFEHGVWVSLFSGVPRKRHGFYDFRQLRPGSYALDLVGPETADLPPPAWAHLHGTGRRVLVVDPPDTRPVPGLDGVQVVEWAAHPHYPPLSFAAEPEGAAAELARLAGPREVIDERIVSAPAHDRPLLDRLLARTRRKAALVRDLVARHAPDLTVAVFAETHTGGHQLWPYRRDAKGDGFRPPGDLGDGLLALYRETDRALATVLAAVSPEATVLVVSSFGMKAMYPTEGLTEAVCRALGYQAAPEEAPAEDADRRRPDVMDLLRRLLPGRLRDGLSRFLSYDTQARLLSQKYERGTDWDRTTAFAVPGYYTGEVRVNLRGREPRGTVAPGADYDDVLSRLESDFLALTHPETGEPVVDRVVRVRDVFGHDAHPALPDLHVLWRPHDHFLDRVVHPRAVLTQPPHPFFRASDHTTEGFLAVAGPGVRAAGRVPDVSPLALAPTLLNILGVPVPDTMPEPPLFFH